MAEGGYFLLNTDGGMDSDGRRDPDDPPGKAGIGVVLKRVNKNNNKEVLIESYGLPVGPKMNDVAEYEALIDGLNLALKHGATHVRAYMDSEFVVEQINDKKQPHQEDLMPLYEDVQRLIGRLAPGTGFRLAWLPRARNEEADDLAARARKAGSRV